MVNSPSGNKPYRAYSDHTLLVVRMSHTTQAHWGYLMRVTILFEATPAERRLLEAAVGVHASLAVLPAPAAGDLREVDVAIAHSFADLDPTIWADTPRLRAVVSMAAGAEHIPFANLRKATAVYSTHGPNADSVAEHAFLLALAAARRLVWFDARLRAGHFDQEVGVRTLHGKTALIVGAGTIGRAIARLARAWRMHVIMARRHAGDISEADATAVGPHALAHAYGAADVVFLAAPLNRANRGMIDAAALASMKDDAILVNVARGKLVDHEALAAHLAAKPTFHYATDVWWRYPRGDTFEELLLARDNIIGTPHTSALAPGWREEMVQAAAKTVAALLSGETPPGREDPASYQHRA